MDYLKYRVCYWLWYCWHSRLRRFFDHFGPPCSSCQEIVLTMQDLANEGYQPAARMLRNFHCSHVKYDITSRPWWHLCCNGNTGGWRTGLCDFLEHKWRYSDYYQTH